MDNRIRLDLGAGHKKYPGWVSVDFAKERARVHSGPGNKEPIKITSDVEADLRSLPFPDDYADEARAIHVIEHFYPWEAESLLREWIRVLKPGAQLAIECPCLDKVLYLAQVPQCPPAFTYWALYGDPRYKDPVMMHKWCYSNKDLAKVMAQAGLVNLKPEPPQFHHMIRDQRVVGFKPMPEPRVVTL